MNASRQPSQRRRVREKGRRESLGGRMRLVMGCSLCPVPPVAPPQCPPLLLPSFSLRTAKRCGEEKRYEVDGDRKIKGGIEQQMVRGGRLRLQQSTKTNEVIKPRGRPCSPLNSPLFGPCWSTGGSGGREKKGRMEERNNPKPAKPNP